ncbi:hypothetical protein ACFVYJ_02540 [Pontibacter sp. JAM-7]|uniref:hypothetical protein n=1 Tax=Pontibacter sp. JAM-7 TaxID=3366581 RepID=UPI003AF444C3
MLKAISMIILAATLSGCLSLSELSANSDESFYAIDRENRFFCRGASANCLDMTKIVSARSMLSPIEHAYQQEITGPNYPVSLMLILMNPSDGAYQATPVGRDGRFFRVPKTTRTDLVWNTLSDIIIEHTNAPGG